MANSVCHTLLIFCNITNWNSLNRNIRLSQTDNHSQLFKSVSFTFVHRHQHNFMSTSCAGWDNLDPCGSRLRHFYENWILAPPLPDMAKKYDLLPISIYIRPPSRSPKTFRPPHLNVIPNLIINDSSLQVPVLCILSDDVLYLNIVSWKYLSLF